MLKVAILDEFVKYEFKLTATSARVPWVKPSSASPVYTQNLN